MNSFLVWAVVAAALAAIASIPAHFIALRLQRAKKEEGTPTWPFAVAFGVAMLGAALLQPTLTELVEGSGQPTGSGLAWKEITAPIG